MIHLLSDSSCLFVLCDPHKMSTLLCWHIWICSGHPYLVASMLGAFFFAGVAGRWCHRTFEMRDLAGRNGFLEVRRRVVYPDSFPGYPDSWSTSMGISSILFLLACLFCHDGLHQENTSLSKPFPFWWLLVKYWLQQWLNGGSGMLPE